MKTTGESSRDSRLWLTLLAVGLAATVFRGAYEQVGNTVALWADSGMDRKAGAFLIPLTWFQSLNPLLVMLMTPPLLAWWRRQASRGRVSSEPKRMAAGAVLVAIAYLMLAAVAVKAGPGGSAWIWLVLFFVVLTFGELFILPTGLGLFARLAPPNRGATAVAAWYCAIFSGSLFAGWVGTLWSVIGRGAFFTLLAALALVAAALLMLLDKPVRKLEARAAVLPQSRDS